MGLPSTIAKGTFHVATRPFVWPAQAVSAGWNRLPSGAKTGLGVGAAVVAGVGFLAYEAMNSSRRGRHLDASDQEMAQIPPLLTPQDLMLQPTQPELSGPAEGRGAFEFRNRVLASRGQMLEQPQVNAMQPARPIIAPESLSDLGAPNKNLAV